MANDTVTSLVNDINTTGNQKQIHKYNDITTHRQTTAIAVLEPRCGL